MQFTIFSHISGAKLQPLLESYTAPDKKESQQHAWKHPKHPKKEWACLVGKWSGNRFNGKLYRHYKEQLSGGIALPTITLEVDPTGGLRQIRLKTRMSNSFLLLVLAFALVAALLMRQILITLPSSVVVPTLVLTGWLLMLGMICGYTHDQYRHECEAIELTLKQMCGGM